MHMEQMQVSAHMGQMQVSAHMGQMQVSTSMGQMQQISFLLILREKKRMNISICYFSETGILFWVKFHQMGQGRCLIGEIAELNLLSQ